MPIPRYMLADLDAQALAAGAGPAHPGAHARVDATRASAIPAAR